MNIVGIVDNKFQLSSTFLLNCRREEFIKEKQKMGAANEQSSWKDTFGGSER
jgi:hypothetical protein